MNASVDITSPPARLMIGLSSAQKMLQGNLTEQKRHECETSVRNIRQLLMLMGRRDPGLAEDIMCEESPERRNQLVLDFVDSEEAARFPANPDGAPT